MNLQPLNSESTLNKIQDLLGHRALDIRTTHFSRFMDQKCTPDVISAIAECIEYYTRTHQDLSFTVPNIRTEPYSDNLIKSIFCKPSIGESTNEYDKFFNQPIRLLTYAGILEQSLNKIGHAYAYNVKYLEILHWIALRELNAAFFLNYYLTAVLTQSGLMGFFDSFFANPSVQNFNTLRDNVIQFYLEHTSIKSQTNLEVKRIFNKIINILAFSRHSLGSVEGRLSKRVITIEQIRYNSTNFRDINKNKNESRAAFLQRLEASGKLDVNKNNYFNYAIKKAKDLVKELEGYSEVHRCPVYGLATQAHHIFPVSEYPELADKIENIILLSPNQHFGYAHPNGNTAIIDENYQLICLLSKLDSIENNIRAGKNDYNFNEFIHVLNVGYNTERFSQIPFLDFEQLKFILVKFHTARINTVAFAR